jgi:hypothetical protein
MGTAYLVYTEHWKWAIVVALMSAFIFTAQYVTTIDVSNRRFIDAFSFFGIAIDTEKTSYKTLDKIVITKGNYSQKATTRSTDRQIHWSDYTGTLIYDHSGALDLLTRQDKKELVEALKIYASALQVDIEDNSIAASLH